MHNQRAPTKIRQLYAWGKLSRFYSIHYQDEFRVKIGVKISEIYHRINSFWFGARPFSLGGARMKKPYKNTQKTIEDSIFCKVFAFKLLLDWMVEHQTIKYEFCDKFMKFWHPSRIWTRLDSGNITVFILFLVVLGLKHP